MNISHHPRHVTVGISGSAASPAALLWAIDHARPGDTLHLVHAWQPTYVSGIAGEDDLPALRMIGREVVRARQIIGAEQIAVSGDVVHGPPARALTAVQTDLLVVGSNDHNWLLATVAGGVWRQILRASTVPVVVVPTARRRPRGSASGTVRVDAHGHQW